jgi:CPA1 family monovalent cation:H+ antiporter
MDAIVTNTIVTNTIVTNTIVTNTIVTNTIVTNTIDLLIAAIVVALIARRLTLPYTVGLVIAGIALALGKAGVDVVLTHDFILDVILPPLLFEAAINIHWRDLRREALPVLTLAILGTLIAATGVTLGVVFLLDWPVRAALLFGVLIAATDPVAVIAMFKDNRTEGRLRLLVESESLFNDGVAAVLFTLAVAGMQAAGTPTWLNAGETLLLTAGGGIAIGLACAGLTILVVGRTTDHLVESTLTTVAAYGSFLLAERFHVSGVLSTVAAGLVVGSLAVLRDDERSRITQRGREFVLGLWEFIAFIANSLVFLMIGVTVAGLPFTRLGFPAGIIVVGLVLIGRALTVYPLCLLFSRSRWAVPLWSQHVLWWGGLRGALGLALALALPPDMIFRNEILIATFTVVVFSVIVQGLTMPWLLRRAI